MFWLGRLWPALFRCGFVSRCFSWIAFGLVWRRPCQHHRRTNNLIIRNRRRCSTTNKNQHRWRYKKGNATAEGAARPTPFQPRWRYNDNVDETAAEAEQPEPKATRATNLKTAPSISSLTERGLYPLGSGRCGACRRRDCNGFPRGSLIRRVFPIVKSKEFPGAQESGVVGLLPEGFLDLRVDFATQQKPKRSRRLISYPNQR